VLIDIVDPAYLRDQIAKLDLSISGLRDAIRGTGNKTLTDLDTRLGTIEGRLDVALSTRLAESTFTNRFPSGAALSDALSNPTTTIVGSALLAFDGTNWRRVRVDTNNRLAIQDPPTLSTLNGKFPSASALGDSLSNPTTTIIGVANLGWDGSYWRRLAADTSSRLKVNAEVVANPSNLDISLSTLRDALRGTGNRTLTDLYTQLTSILSKLDVNLSTRLADSKIPNTMGQVSLDVAGSTMYALAMVDYTLPSRMPYMIDNINVSTTESSTSIAAPGAKIVKITNKSDTDVLIGINGSVPTTNPLILKARTAKIFCFKGVTAVYYKTASGTATISIEYFN